MTTTVERLDPRAVEKINSVAWSRLRPLVLRIHADLIACGPNVEGRLTTIYIKYMADAGQSQTPFAVVWIKKSSEVVIGVSLKAEEVVTPWVPQLPGFAYAGLTAFMRLTDHDQLPANFAECARAAFRASES